MNNTGKYAEQNMKITECLADSPNISRKERKMIKPSSKQIVRVV